MWLLRVCQPRAASPWPAAAIVAAYLAAASAAQGPWLPLHASSLASQAASVAALLGVVAVAGRGCGRRWTLAWLTAGALALNVVARLISLVAAPGREGEARFVRWDAAARAFGLVAVLAEVYYAVVPRARFRTTFFALSLAFVLPVVLALPRLVGGPRVDAAVLRAAADAAASAYIRYDGRDASTRVAMLRRDGVAYVAFAGTEGAADARVDAKISDVRAPGVPGRVHAGFAAAYAASRPELVRLRELAADRGERVVFAGHSLGGALATLAAAEFGGECVTFGAPQVGDVDFARATNAAARVVRVVNPFDPVPKLLAGQLVHTEGYHLVTSLTRDSPLTAHGLKTYALALGRPRWLQLAGALAPATYVGVAALAVAAARAWT